MAYEQLVLIIVLAAALLMRAVREASERRAEAGRANASPSRGRATPDAVLRPVSSEPLTRRSAHGAHSIAPERRPAPRRRAQEPGQRDQSKQALAAASHRPLPGLGDASSLRAAIRLMTVLLPPRALSAASGGALRQRKRERRQGQR
jgi:hypothetical protein